MTLPAESKPQTLVLLSGGLDSAVCLNFYQQSDHNLAALFIDYGQPSANRELAAAIHVARWFDVELDQITAAGLPEFGDGFVRGRNAFLLMTALMSFKSGSGLIALGIHAGTSYSDCSEEFVVSMRKLFDLYSSGAIMIDAPLLSWNKVEIWNYALSNSIPVADTYSCELGLDQPCGVCLSCRDVEMLNASEKLSTNA